MNRPDRYRIIIRIVTWISIICTFLAIQSLMLDYMYNYGQNLIQNILTVIAFVVLTGLAVYLQRSKRK